MKLKFNGISPWILFKVYKKEGNTGYFKFWSVMWFSHFLGQSGYSTPASILNYYELGRLSQQEEETMNDNLNTNNGNAEFKPVPLSDAELAKLLETKPTDGEVVGYVTDTDEAADEPTVH